MKFLDLPTELLELVLDEILDVNTLANLRLVCTKFNQTCSTCDRFIKAKCLALSRTDLECKLLGKSTLISASCFKNYLFIYPLEARIASYIGFRLSRFLVGEMKDRKDHGTYVDTAKEVLEVTLAHCGFLFPSEDEAWQYMGPYESIFFAYIEIGHPEKAILLADDVIVQLEKTGAAGTKYAMQKWTEHRNGVA